MHPMAMLLDKVRATARGEITARASAVSADEFGELAHAFDSMAVDLVNSLKKEIDERKVAERQSAESEFRLRTIVENEPECVKITDAQGNLLQMNPSGLMVIGADSLEQVVGHSVLDLVLPDYHDAYLNFHQKVLAGETKNLEFQILNLKGGSRWVESTATPIDYKGERVILAVTRDITARKQAEAVLENHRQNLELLIKERTAELENAKLIAEAANIAKSAFLSNMSHEIRTPLNAITGMAHLIKRSGVTAEQLDRLEKIDVAGRHLLEIINSILDLSKIEAGKFELQEVALNLSELVANLVSIISDRVKEKNLELEVVVQPVSCNLIGDPTRIQQALLNYATNAIKFTSNGKISLRATVLDEDHDSVLFRFEIQDTGIGISSDVLPKLFSSFEQADNSIARKYGGTGLGLAINKKLAQLMGGDAGATSTLGMGSIFWFTARLKKTESSIVHVSKDALLSAETSLSRAYTGYRILLAEDEPINREITLELLSDLGLVVDVAEDGLKAFDFAMKNKYHLILMDMQMPNMDGLEATRQIRKLPNGKDVPVLAMTANAFDDDKRRCFDAGMNDFITKPVVPEMFFNTLLNWLSRSPMH